MTSASQEPVHSVEDFVPDEGLDASCLEDTKDFQEVKKQAEAGASSDRLVSPRIHFDFCKQPGLFNSYFL